MVGPVGKWRGCWENGLWEWLRNHLELSKVQKAPEAPARWLRGAILSITGQVELLSRWLKGHDRW